MASYFLAIHYTGLIGLITAVLSLLYFFAAGLIVNFAVQRTHRSDLRIRIAASSGYVGILREIFGSKQSSGTKKSRRVRLLLFIFLFSLGGEFISIIVTTGVKATVGIQMGTSRTVTDVMGRSSTADPKFTALPMPTRENSSTLLTDLYNWYMGSNEGDVIFQPLPVTSTTSGYLSTIQEVLIGNDIVGNPLPGSFIVSRQMYNFRDDEGNVVENKTVCEPTSSGCKVKYGLAHLSPYIDQGLIIDAPIRVLYFQGNVSFNVVAEAQDAPGAGRASRLRYIAERPTTMISTLMDTNGTAIYVAITSASFQTQLTDKSSDLVKDARDTIGSTSQLYPTIFNSINRWANITKTQAPSEVLTNSTVYVYNAADAGGNNDHHVFCVGYMAGNYYTDHGSRSSYAVSCRELRISVLVNRGTWTNIPATSNDSLDSSVQSSINLVNIYRYNSPSGITVDDVPTNTTVIDTIENVASNMSVILTNLSSMILPGNIDQLGTAIPFTYVDGIRFELWAIVFIVGLVVIVVIITILDMVLNDALSKATLVNLIEYSTASDRHEMSLQDLDDSGSSRSGKSSKAGLMPQVIQSEFPPWALIEEGRNRYHIRLRSENIGVFSTENTKFSDR